VLGAPAIVVLEDGDIRRFTLTGKGRFDVTLCDEDYDKESIALPAEAPTSPLELEIDGKAVSIASAFALATRDPAGTYYTLAFFTSPARCVDGGLRLTTNEKLVVQDIGRSAKEDLTTSNRQPARASFIGADSVGTSGSNAWVTLHDLSATRLKGELVARTTERSSFKVLTAGGQFEAEICGDW
jgi:hypothetical protein